MIHLVTGATGDGKSLWTISTVKARAEKEGRAVYYAQKTDKDDDEDYGIYGLTLPWVPLPDKARWFDAPAGSIIVVDECQKLFRPRGNGTAVPEYESRLETHRHAGHDLYIITQHPMLLSANVRRLVKRHFHIKRTFGHQAAVVHEFSDVNEHPERSRADSVSKPWSYPKEAFGYYHSAEAHTSQKSIPKRVYFLGVLPLILAGLMWGVYGWMDNFSDPPPSAAAAAPPTQTPGHVSAPQLGQVPMPAHNLDDHRPRVPGLAYTAPVYDAVNQVRSAPRPAACVMGRGQCDCYTQQGTRLEVPRDICMQIVEQGWFDPTRPDHPFENQPAPLNPA